MKNLTKEEAQKLAWGARKVAAFYLRNDQLPLYQTLYQWRDPFLECSRRYGKTTTILCYVIEKLLANPGWVALWCEPDKNQAREVVKPELEKIFESAPKALHPKWNYTDSYYEFPNGSKLKLRGVNHDRGNSARGSFAHIIVADEFGFWVDPDYIVLSALSPQLLTTRGQFIYASTPPEDLGHAYYTYKGYAINDGRFIGRTIYDNESLTEQDIQDEMKKHGGAESPSWQREYLCRPVASPDRLIIPEYRDELCRVADDYPFPPHFDAYVGMDLGFNDFTGGLFAHYDFANGTLVIDDELLVKGKNSREITDAAKEIEKKTWNKAPYLRISDNDLQQIFDMQTLCDYPMLATAKDDRLAAINALRLRFSQGKIKIKARCKALNYQLKVGLWNDRRTDFHRGEKIGHLDLIAALIYLHRNVQWNRNPYPQNVGIRPDTHWINPSVLSSQGENKALQDALRPLGRR